VASTLRELGLVEALGADGEAVVRTVMHLLLHSGARPATIAEPGAQNQQARLVGALADIASEIEAAGALEDAASVSMALLSTTGSGHSHAGSWRQATSAVTVAHGLSKRAGRRRSAGDIRLGSWRSAPRPRHSGGSAGSAGGREGAGSAGSGTAATAAAEGAPAGADAEDVAAAGGEERETSTGSGGGGGGGGGGRSRRGSFVSDATDADMKRRPKAAQRMEDAPVDMLGLSVVAPTLRSELVWSLSARPTVLVRRAPRLALFGGLLSLGAAAECTRPPDLARSWAVALSREFMREGAVAESLGQTPPPFCNPHQPRVGE